MTFDGITTRAVVLECKNHLLDSHVNKINQISDHEIILQFYGHGENYSLYISTLSSSCRFYLSQKKYTNPLIPPNFVMVLRKHLSRSRLISIEQIGLDRTVEFSFEASNELGDAVKKYLIVEIMGKQSNIILLDENRIILDALKRVSSRMSRAREIFPGLSYQVFPSNKLEILEKNYSLKDMEWKKGKLFKNFYQNFTGFSPVISKEICYRAAIDPNEDFQSLQEEEKMKLKKELDHIILDIQEGNFSPSLYQDPAQYYCLELKSLGERIKTSSSISQIIESFSHIAIEDDRVKQKKSHLSSPIKQLLEREDRKFEKQKRELEKTKDSQEIKLEADLLGPVVHKIQKGQETIEVEDFYNPGKLRKIDLDPKKTPWDNIQAKYKKASKYKTAHKLLQNSLPKLKEDIQYLAQLLLTIDEAKDMDILEEIEEEIIKEGIIKKKSKKKKQKQEKTSSPHQYLTKNNSTIYVGKNNKQNDYLTLKLAGKEDYFFHAQTIPGAHVILKNSNKEVTADDLHAGAYLAAIYSSAKKEHYVDIDYTQKKNVYKAKGAKLGMVYYNNFQTIRIDTSIKPEIEKTK